MSIDNESYFTLAKEAVIELKIERSQFIGHAREAEDTTAAQEFIAAVSLEHRRATHNCFAYRLGLGDTETVYYSDAGEPGGTAGRPILGAITSLDLTNVVVVVTRYFGGKKLGIRGLIEAYGQTARLTLEAGGRVKRILTQEMEIKCSYAELDRLLYMLDSRGGRVLSTDYGAKIRLKAAVPYSLRPEIKRLFPDPEK